MKRKLLKQMRNEWRDNVWLVIELAVVFIAIWGLSTVLWVMTKGAFTPLGVDPENVISLSTRYLKSDNPSYVNVDSVTYNDDLRQLLRELRANPNVEAVAVHGGALPFNYNYNGTGIKLIDSNDSVIYYANQRYGSPDIVKVLGIRSLTGATSDQLVEMLRNGEILVSDNQEYKLNGRNPFDLKGKRVIMEGDSSKLLKVGDVIQQIRRSEYEPSWAGGIIYPLDYDGDIWGDVVLRVKPGREMQFKEDFRNNENLRKYRNVYLSDMKRLVDIRTLTQHNDEIKIRMFSSLMIFLLVTVFLGIAGTFWFRVQQRVSEIAIRKVNGATRMDVFRRILSEGTILLLCSSLIISVLVWPFISKFMDMLREEWYVFLILELVSFALIAIGVLMALWYPAHRAMSIEPAIAIKEE